MRFSLNTEIKPNKNETIFFNCFLSEIENFLIINEINHNKKLITKIKKKFYILAQVYMSQIIKIFRVKNYIMDNVGSHYLGLLLYL